MHINKIEFDAKGFFTGQQVRFNLQPVLANYKGLLPDIPNKRFYTLDVDNWVSMSQGAIISWR